MPSTTRMAWRVATIAALAAAAAGSAAAQDLEAERGGLTSSFGVSLSSAGISCVPDCSSSRRTGPTYMVRGGAHLTGRFSVVVEGDLYRQGVDTPNGPGTWAMSWYMLGVLIYPRAEEDVFLSLGAGLAVGRMHVTFPDVGALKLNTSNLGASVGIGRDIRFRDKSAITTYAQYLFSGRTPALIGRSESGARVSSDLLTVGLAYTLF